VRRLFAIGWLAHALTLRALQSETLAQRQADELALLNRINALAIENSPDGLLAVAATAWCATPARVRWRCSASRRR